MTPLEQKLNQLTLSTMSPYDAPASTLAIKAATAAEPVRPSSLQTIGLFR